MSCFRPVVPGFAGVAQVGFWRTAIPISVASGIWYGLLVYLGAFAGRNLEAIIGIFDSISSVLLWIAVALLVGVAFWWWRTRHHHHDNPRA